MKLKSFRVRNYKSIIDSGECRLSDTDNILILAGQNESGKSAILQALHDYERGELSENSERALDGESFKYPVIQCTYTIQDSDDIIPDITEKKGLPEDVISILNGLDEVTIIREFITPNDSVFTFDDSLIQKFTQKNNVNKKTTEASDEAVRKEGDTIEISKLAESIWSASPKILFFDDFCDLLPNKILITSLSAGEKNVKGYNAVRNVEKLLDTDFTKYDKWSDALRASIQKNHTESMTADFNDRWNQKIFDDNKVEIVVEYNQGRAAGQSYLNFFVITKKGEYLTPEQRSKGLIWFLSFYLQLTADSKDSDELIILFDEPGLYLHSKAQNDIKSLFEELGEKDQIIYSTHSPYLIDADKLGRLRLIINSKEEGTTVNKITTKKIQNQKDALKPIIDAIGLEVAHDFSCLNAKNVILEGISDYHYFTSMKNLLGVQDDFAFLPSMGAPNVHLLMELCVGWGLDWLIIFDEDRASKTAFNKIKKSFFNSDEDGIGEKIHCITDVEGIEDIFTLTDLRLVDSRIQNPDNLINSKLVEQYGGKELFARIFSEKVNKGSITLDNLSRSAKDKFTALFEFINNGFKD